MRCRYGWACKRTGRWASAGGDIQRVGVQKIQGYGTDSAIWKQFEKLAISYKTTFIKVI